MRQLISVKLSAEMFRIITLLVLLLMALAPTALAQCLKCQPELVNLEGVIYAKNFAGPPNYESIRHGDQLMRYWILRLTKPVCVEGDDFDRARVPEVRELQLVFADDSFYQKYRAFVRRRTRFRIAGSLFHQHTGHHVTKILLKVDSLAPLRK